MDPTSPAYHTDWVISIASNVHVCSNRDWYTRFTPFRTAIDTGLITNSIVSVEGIGDIELPLELSERHKPLPPDNIITQRLVLRDVLYTTETPANIVGFGLLARYHRCRFEVGCEASAIVDMGTRKRIAVVDNTVLPHLRLRNQPFGRSSLDPEGVYAIRAMWPEEERQRWQRFRAMTDEPRSPQVSNGDSGSDALLPLSEQEKRFLKRHWKNEFNFLRDHGLKLMNDEDRAEGRQILKSLMVRDEEKRRMNVAGRSNSSSSKDSSSSKNTLTVSSDASEKMRVERKVTVLGRHNGAIPGGLGLLESDPSKW